MAGPVRLDDWHRLSFGDSAPGFLIEVVARTTLLYLLLLFAMRLMGRRVASQLSRTELAVILTLGAAIGMPIQMAESGLLPVLVILLAAIAFQRGISYASLRSSRAEKVVQGAVCIVVRDGRFELSMLRELQLSVERMRMSLRAQGVQQLGELRRVYVESAGSFSLVKFATPRAGLSILANENDHVADVQQADPSGTMACRQCGAVASEPRRCSYCHAEEFAPAVRAREVRADR